MDYQDLLMLARELLYCPVCQAKFDAEKISPKGVFGDKLIIHTQCSKGHKRVDAIFISSINNASPLLNSRSSSITDDEILDFKIGLDKFNGDFIAAFENLDIKDKHGRV